MTATEASDTERGQNVSGLFKYFSEADDKKFLDNYDWQTAVTCLAYGNTWEFCKMTMNLEKSSAEPRIYSLLMM